MNETAFHPHALLCTCVKCRQQLKFMHASWLVATRELMPGVKERLALREEQMLERLRVMCDA